jgi:hypothetical protein
MRECHINSSEFCITVITLPVQFAATVNMYPLKSHTSLLVQEDAHDSNFPSAHNEQAFPHTCRRCKSSSVSARVNGYYQ